MRPLVLNYPDDPRTWTLDHEYLWGDDLLVAPVTREGASAWPVYLPSGRWFDFWTGSRYEGPGGATLARVLPDRPQRQHRAPADAQLQAPERGGARGGAGRPGARRAPGLATATARSGRRA